MIQAEKIKVDTDVIGCDGGGSPLGHPMVYLKIVTQRDTVGGDVICPYCSRHFIITTDTFEL